MNRTRVQRAVSKADILVMDKSDDHDLLLKCLKCLLPEIKRIGQYQNVLLFYSEKDNHTVKWPPNVFTRMEMDRGQKARDVLNFNK